MERELGLSRSFWLFRVPGKDSFDFLQTSSADSSRCSWPSFLWVTEALKQLIQLPVGEQLKQGPEMWVPTQPTRELPWSSLGDQSRAGPRLTPMQNCLTQHFCHIPGALLLFLWIFLLFHVTEYSLFPPLTLSCSFLPIHVSSSPPPSWFLPRNQVISSLFCQHHVGSLWIHAHCISAHTCEPLCTLCRNRLWAREGRAVRVEVKILL